MIHVPWNMQSKFNEVFLNLNLKNIIIFYDNTYNYDLKYILSIIIYSQVNICK